jgi:hypothetical protein
LQWSDRGCGASVPIVRWDRRLILLLDTDKEIASRAGVTHPHHYAYRIGRAHVPRYRHRRNASSRGPGSSGQGGLLSANSRVTSSRQPIRGAGRRQSGPLIWSFKACKRVITQPEGEAAKILTHCNPEYANDNFRDLQNVSTRMPDYSSKRPVAVSLFEPECYKS